MIRFCGIDPANKTGFVALDEKGNVLVEKELTGTKGGPPEYRIAALLFEIKDHIRRDDVVGIESFAFEAMDVNKMSSGANWAGRLATALTVKDKELYVSPGPGQIKKFLQVKVPRGTKTKVTKAEIVRKAEIRFNYPGLISDNTADAMTIAHITRYVYLYKTGQFDIRTLPEYEFEVIFQLADKDEYDKYVEKKEDDERERKAEAKRQRAEAKRKGIRPESVRADNAPTLF